MTPVANGQHHSVDTWRRETFAPGTPTDATITERRLWSVNPQDYEWRSQYLHEIPNWLAGYLAVVTKSCLLVVTGVAVPIHSCARLSAGVYCHVCAKWLRVTRWPLTLLIFLLVSRWSACRH